MGASDASLSTTYTPDPSSPLFLLSSDVPGVSLVSLPFSGTAEDTSQFKQWDRYNNMVISWLTNSLSPGIAESVQYSDTAESIWAQLNRRYGSVSGIKVFEIKQEITSTHQGSLDIASYFNKLKKLWDELRFMCTNHANTCVCVAKPGLQKEEEENRLHQFLMGLDETYVGVRSNLLMMQPPPSLDTAYSILLQDEKQRRITPNSHFQGDSASFHVNLNNKSAPPRQFTQKVSFDQNKSPLLCKSMDFHQFTKGKRTAVNVEVQSSVCASEPATVPTESLVYSNSVIPGLSKDQYAQLLMLLQQHHILESLPQSSLMASANFAGIVPSPDCVGKVSYGACMLTRVHEYTWIIDSGATNHITSKKELLFDIQPLVVPYLVTLPNGHEVKVTCAGSLHFLSFTLHHVLYVPCFQHNLISVHKLVAQLDCLVLFGKFSCFLIHAPSMKRPLEIGKQDHGLYKLVQPCPQSDSHY
ncbi:PREDICTED: uncharacterized protein LOC109224266 [Nicotiana attenuata]|uniref:uncharacterized protein LOC109224266 n=1 Tax=Nicotiana attenuata TaxID=49451 RepID=UPI00090555C1|nr:PREDICTED: uncharacterized protein LOC109224266 [Nicotiana attenuata]